MSFFDKWIHVGSTIEESADSLLFTCRSYRFCNRDGSWAVETVSDFLNEEVQHEGEEFDAFEHLLTTVSYEGMKETLTDSGDVPLDVIRAVLKYTGTIEDVDVSETKKSLVDKCTDTDLRILKFCLDKKKEDVEWFNNVYNKTVSDSNTKRAIARK